MIGLRSLGHWLEQGFLILPPCNVGYIDADMVRCVNGGSDQPFPGRQPSLFAHGPDLRGIVVTIFNYIVYKFHRCLRCRNTMIPRQRDRCGYLITHSVN